MFCCYNNPVSVQFGYWSFRWLKLRRLMSSLMLKWSPVCVSTAVLQDFKQTRTGICFTEGINETCLDVFGFFCIILLSLAENVLFISSWRTWIVDAFPAQFSFETASLLYDVHRCHKYDSASTSLSKKMDHSKLNWNSRMLYVSVLTRQHTVVLPPYRRLSYCRTNWIY